MTLTVNKSQEQNMEPANVGGRLMGTFKQRQDEVITYEIDYSGWLADSETITAVNYVVAPSTTPAAVIIGSTISGGNKVLFQIDNGAEGTRYTVNVTITTSTAQTKVDFFTVTIGTFSNESAQVDVVTASSTAVNARALAEAAATSAQTSATNAAGSASTALSGATTATTKAAEAVTSASNAAASASTATTKASEASTSASNAAASAATATTRATEATTSAATATISANEAAVSAANAAGNTAIAIARASEAATSATNAAASATTATARASEAATSATNAATSATTATTRASEAATSATNAATSATTASNNAAAASTSANNAATSATNASNSASAAATARTAAESARDATLAAYDSFDDRYLGPKASDPTLDNDGNALVGGTLYFNTVSQSMKLYTGSAWVNAYVSGDIALLKANNLSDLTNTATARSNLGLSTLATTTPGTGVATALGVNVGSAGAFVTNGGALGTPSSGNLANCTFPTLNQNTTGTAAGLSATLNVASGGTGLTSLTAGQIPFGNGTSAFGSSANLFWDDTNSRLVRGNSAAIAALGITPALQSHGTTTSACSGSLNGWGSASPFWQFNRSAGSIGVYTSVASGNILGALNFSGADGTDFIQGALIRVEVDSAPSSSSMPARIAFLTTTSGSSTATERMRIDSSGNVGIGALPAVGYSVTLGGTLTSTTDPTGFGILATAPSTSTGAIRGFQTNISTAAASFTSSTLIHFNAIQGTIGAGSTVTNQFGFQAHSSLIGATNNYGFFSNIASGTGRWNFYANGTANNYFAGNTFVGNNTALTFANPVGTITPQLQIVSAGTSTSAGAAIVNNTTGANSSVLTFGKSRGNSASAPTIVSSGDALGGMFFNGYDGSAYIRAASITSATDGTPASGDMAGRIMFSTTPAGSAVPTERLRIDSSGNVGIGTSTTSTGRLSVVQQTDGEIARFQRGGGTNIPILRFNLTESTGVAEIEQTGGVVGPLTFKTGGAERMRIDSSGRIGIGTSALTSHNFRLLASSTGAADMRGMSVEPIFQSDVTSSAFVFNSRPQTAAANFTLTNLTHYTADQNTIGVGSTVTNQYGFSASATLIGATNNFGFYSNIASGTGRWNFYANGTADNYFAGRTFFGLSNVSVPTNFASNAWLQANVTIGAAASFSNFSAAVFGGRIDLNHSRSTTVGGHTALVANDSLGDIYFGASDGSAFAPGARIFSEAEATASAGSAPSRLAFSTTASGATSPTERMRITSSGNVGIGTSSPNGKFHVVGDISQFTSTNAFMPQIIAHNQNNGTSGPYFLVQKGRAASGASAAVQVGDTLGTFIFRGFDTSGVVQNSAYLATNVAAVGATSVDGTMEFLTYGSSSRIVFATNGSERARFDGSGNFGIGTGSPTTKLDVNADKLRVRTAKTPASATDTGNQGDVCWDASYIYVCTATNTWKRAAIATW